MEFAILGPLEVRVHGEAVALGGPKQRGVLALLLLHANDVVSRAHMIEGVWGERAPSSAERSLDSYVSRLRTIVGVGRIERRAPGYAVCVRPGELDLERFEALLEQGREALAAADAGRASGLLHDALALWRGPALADLLYEPFAGEEAPRLEERRLLALETRIDADLELGRGVDVLAELEQLVAENPFRERLVGQLMLCLYQDGRSSDALAAYQRARQRLSDELGLEPSPQLRELERRILTHDPALGPAPAARAAPQRRGRRRVVTVLAVGVLVSGAVAAAVAVGASESGGSPAASSPLVELSQKAGGAAASELSDAPAAMAADERSIWVAEPNVGAIVRVDRASRRVVQSVPLAGSPGAVAVGGGAVWAAGVPGDVVWRIDPATGEPTQKISLGGAQVAALAYGFGKIWIADATDRTLIALDPLNGGVARTLELLVRPTALAIGRRSIWVADYDAGSVTAVDPKTAVAVATARVGNGPAALAVGSGAVWVANSLDSTVSRVNAATGAVAATIAVGSYPVALAAAGGSVWVADEYSSTVSEVRGDAVKQTARVAGGPTAIVSAAGRIWVGTRVLEQRAGGTLRLLHTRPLLVDPALQLDLGTTDGFTRDGLVADNHATGAQGLHLVPDLALALPPATGGGTTYTFHLRPGIRYSNGEPLRARDFRRAFERLFRLGSAGGDYFRGIRGAAACTATHCDLSRGVATDEATRTVSFRLVAPDPGFLEKLTIGGLSSPVPPGTPWYAARTPVPGTGPYRMEHADQREIRFVRNPFFHEWSHAAQPAANPDEIVMRFGLSPAQEVRAVERDEADWTADGVPPELLPEVNTRYTSRVHSYVSTDTEFLQFNTTLAPFDDVRVRRALNYAVDRAVVARLFGGVGAATPTCQVLPPGIVGYRKYCPYTLRPAASGRWQAPDLATARRLVAASHTRGRRITIWGSDAGPVGAHKVLPYVARVLRRLGYRARVHLVPPDYFANAPASVFRRIQMTPPGWADETPYNFFAPWLTCAAAYNHGWFCDPRLDREIGRAQALESTDPRGAAARWATLDRLVTDAAAWVPLVNPRQIDFVSARVRNYQHGPLGGIIADQLVVR